jgi:hypothetical protein
MPRRASAARRAASLAGIGALDTGEATPLVIKGQLSGQRLLWINQDFHLALRKGILQSVSNGTFSNYYKA